MNYGGATSQGTEHLTNWVGIGGYGGSTLIQLGIGSGGSATALATAIVSTVTACRRKKCS